MRFDYSGTELFLSYLAGDTAISRVIEHPAYQTVFRHASKFSDGLSAHDIERAVQGEKTPFYAMSNVYNNINGIREFITTIKEHEVEWLDDIHNSIYRLNPLVSLDSIVIYPIIGYDAGIGVDDSVCMNLNWWQKYLETPHEFLYTAIHEVFHAIYERTHIIPELESLDTPKEQLSYFYLMLQNEGFAVYSPLKLRKEREHLGSSKHQILEDYVVLCDQKAIQECIDDFFSIVKIIRTQRLDLDEFVNVVFGRQRITYRVGCELARRIERNYGTDEVRKAVLMSGDKFVNKYVHLLKPTKQTTVV